MSQSASQGGQPPLAPRRGKVTVVGAGFYGSTTAQRLAEYDIFEEVVLTDIVEGKPEGLALDMNQSRPVEGFETKVTGQTTGPAGEGYEVIGGSDIVIVTAGLPRKPGMSRMDLIETNAKIVRSVVENVAKYAPDAVLIGDYKTDRPAPQRSADVPLGYLRQLALYRALLTRIYPGRSVRAALIWTDVPSLMELSEDALEREIALLTCL